ncbi:MAG: PAS domain-containing sensor histidine kinase [Caryophanon sp.]|nr:PAS domain-containing sensor histidine kinase [Caryophanon sp.]
MTLTNNYFKEIYEHIQDGIIVMTTSRTIVMMNPAAERLTGWSVGESVPYCTYCQERVKASGEPTCYLIANSEVPSFLSQMPTYHGKQIDVEMSTAAIYANTETGETEYLLVLRDQELLKKAQEVDITKKMMHALIDARESEHKRLAQELHDGVGQSLFTVSVALQAVNSFIHDNPKLSSYITEVQHELQRAMDDVKAYSHRLRPHSLDQLGLVPTIQTMLKHFDKNMPHIAFSFQSHNVERYAPVVEINVYRVVQEAIHNVLKYANAKNVSVTLTDDADYLHVTITDDGIGFDRKQLQSEGLGLKHMEERMAFIDGTCRITSAIGEGTTIELHIPRWQTDEHRISR